jgi:hypothetical protein
VKAKEKSIRKYLKRIRGEGNAEESFFPGKGN